MKKRTKLTAAALAALLSTTALGIAVHAETATPQTAKSAEVDSSATAAMEAAAYETQSEMLTTADEALAAITRVHAARLALFNGDIADAKARVGEASAALRESERDLNSLLIKDFDSDDSTARYLPFDMSMVLTEGFSPTDANRSVIERVRGLLEEGQSDEAVAELRLAEIDVSVSTAMLPYEETAQHLKKATAFLDDGNYFEANLALKEIEDSVVVRSFSIDSIPIQGHTG